MSQKRFFVRMQTRRGGGRDRRPRGARASRWALESLEPRLLLSSAPLDPLAVDLTVDPALAPAPVAAPPGEAGARSPAAQLAPDAIGPLAAEAIHRLSLAGVDPESVARLHDIEIQVVDLPGWTVATTTGTGIALDREAAGRGWFLDPTPADDAEFTVDGARLAAGEGPAREGIDLLTVLAHEFGHQLGLDHAPAGEGASALDALMERGIRPGVRRIEAMAGPSGDGLVLPVPAGTPRIGDALEIAETIRWNTDASGFWDVASNWIDTATLQARTPTASDDVRIDRGAANPVVTVRTATAAARHVLVAESVVVAGGGTLDLSGTLGSTGTAEVSGGTLRRAAIEAGTTVTVTATGGTLNGVTVAGTVLAPTNNLVVTGGMNLETGALFQIGAMSSGSAAIARFNGDQTIGGPGEIRLVGPGRASMIVNGNLTIAAGTAIDGLSGDINIQGGTLINRGTIGPSAGGSLNLGLAGATQNWTNEAGGRLVASGGALGLGGAWSNAGEIAVGAAAGSALFLGGAFTTAGLGTLLRDGTAANSISLTGTLDNTGATVMLDATTGSWFLQGGTLKGGTLRTQGGAQLLDTTSGGLLTGITLDGSVMLVRAAIAGGLTLASGALVQIGGVLASGNFLHGDVSLSGDQTVGGTGEIRFAGARGLAVSRLRVGGNAVLDTGITVAGQAGDFIITGSLTNRGLIAPAGGDFVIGFAGQSWTNAAGGRLRADGGVLVLGGNWSNAGEIAVGATAGSALYLGGNFTTAAIGTIVRQGTAGNSVNIIGTLDNTGATLALDDTTGSWVMLTNGTVKGGTVTTTAGTRSSPAGASSTASPSTAPSS